MLEKQRQEGGVALPPKLMTEQVGPTDQAEL